MHSEEHKLETLVLSDLAKEHKENGIKGKKILTCILVAFVALTVVSCKKDPGPSKLVGDVTYRDNQIPGVEVTLTGDTGVFKYTTITDGYFKLNNSPFIFIIFYFLYSPWLL